MTLIALAAVIVAIVGSFWAFDNSEGVGCGSVLVSTTEAADRDAVMREEAVLQLAVPSGGTTGDAYQNNLMSPEEFANSPEAVLVGTGNVGLCEHTRSTVRTYLYSSTATALVLAAVGWIWMRRRSRPAREHGDS